MKNSKAPKIVVAVALAAVYGTGLAMVTLRDSPGSHGVENVAVAPTPQMVEQPAVMNEAPALVASTMVDTVGPATRESEFVKVEAPAREVNIVREQVIPSVAPVSPAETSRIEKSSSSADVATGEESANSTVDAASSEEAESESAGDDSPVDADANN